MSLRSGSSMAHHPSVPEIEGIVEPATGESWKVFRRRLVPKYAIVWRDIVICYLALALGVGIQAWIGPAVSGPWHWALVVPFAIWTGYWLHGLVLFMHEAAHFGVHPKRAMNDRLSDWLICSVFAQNITSYRKVHWEHHRDFGGSGDTEISYRYALTFKFIFATLIGYHILRVKLRWLEGTTEPSDTQNKERTSLAGPIRFLFLHGTILVFCVWSDRWDIAASWALGLFSFFPMFAALRTILEHRSEWEIPGRGDNFMFGTDLLSSSYGQAGFNRHLLHHMDPQVSYTRFSDMETALMQTSLAGRIERARATYPMRWDALRADARVVRARAADA
jgi:fatty acid desaturase